MSNLSRLKGWDALNLDHPEYVQIREDNSKKGEGIAKLLHRVFRQTEEGQRVLELFERQFLMKPVSPPGSSEGFNYFREGQNDVVRQILQNCELAEKIK